MTWVTPYDLRKPKLIPYKDPSFNEKLTKNQCYLPKGLTDKILDQRGKIEGERKQVTVMFCDMEGFTILFEKIGPEEAYSLLGQVYEVLIHKVHHYEGTVNEMTGDALGTYGVERGPCRSYGFVIEYKRNPN